MLSWVRKKRRYLAPPLMAVLISSLLSLTCQHCLASAAHDMGVVNDSMAGHMTMGASEQQNTKYDPCNVFCNCEDNFISADDNRSMDNAVNRDVSSFKISLIHDYDDLLIPAGNNRFINTKPHIPDRACFSPLERNCVLLN